MSRAEWLKKDAFGVMVHYLPHICDRRLRCEPDWESSTHNFDLSVFCDTLQAVGAGWVIFPFGQNTGPYCSPNSVIERLAGKKWVIKRDLMGELAVELARRDMSLIGYLPSEMWMREPELQEAFGWDAAKSDKSVFQRNWQEVIACWGVRLGTALAGWWFDGCYEADQSSWIPKEKNNWNNRRFNREEWFLAARTGNPERSVAMNNGANRLDWVFAGEEDYLSGELNDLLPPPIKLPPQMLPHALLWLDCLWMHTPESYAEECRTGSIPAPRYTVQALRDWLRLYRKRGGGCTINVGIYRDGSLSEESVAFLRRLEK